MQTIISNTEHRGAANIKNVGKKRILITGANGQLGKEFSRLLPNYPYEVQNAGHDECNISDSESVEKVFAAFRPDIVFNCAAYNLVDKAEEEYEVAFDVNARGVKNLASASQKNGAFLVHYSTDYVFDGTKNDFYTEEDIPEPLNAYGRSKLAGEELLRKETDRFLLLRVSWVFGDGRQNFLYKLSQWAKTNRMLRVVCDQISVPTYTRDIASITMFALNKGLTGLYHLTAGGYATRYEVARYFLEKLGMDNLILPVNSDEFPSPARRPFFSAMSNRKLSEALNIEIPDWKVGIQSYVKTAFEGGEAL